jgi:hypothetical protein
MKIALLAWESLHSIRVGGVAVHVSELATAPARKGHELHVFTRMGAGQPPYKRIRGVHYHRCGFLSAQVTDLNQVVRCVFVRGATSDNARSPN